ncbi:hypothetical protein [Methanonatronarchaeum sp. AMET6-2]|uniref:hypothetical protein n=1 Tax=Methanonatronarchaeum sp. AMET6-2 TaxID=2933293 RepID=UPI00122B032C|nr:hypothetical protein [Methanonatronarchaeum sp. AMET6-2]RZN60537.1 MAG: hypothetical protein EF811_06395 [Methanonatronarchaeia archaeon]UOY10474.1 hypothetical protein MU439_02235 [Methanonatronarchaeum sp. AMET6-2]
MENKSIHRIDRMENNPGNSSSYSKYDLMLTAIPILFIATIIISYISVIPMEAGIISASLLSTGLIMFGIMDIAPEKQLNNN